MELYNSIIKRAETLAGGSVPKCYKYDESKAWKEDKDFEFILARDVAFEFGSNAKKTTSYTAVTDSEELVPADEIVVYGPEISEIKEDHEYARITILRVRDMTLTAQSTPEEKDVVFREIQNLDFIKYHVYPTGFMIRTSAESNRENVRVAKSAIKEGISFEKIGATYIKRYKADPKVCAVKIIFITAKDAQYDALVKEAKSVHDITMTLSKILEGMPTDCGSCGLKAICDEVEGMKELHFGKNKK